MLKAAIHRLGAAYMAKTAQSEATGQRFRRHNERPAEYSFVFRAINRCARKNRLLDVGSGTTALPALISDCGCVVTAIDNVSDYWPAGMVNRHWHVEDDDISRTERADRFDMVTCISVLEHIKDHQGAMRKIMGLLKPGGHLVLAGPYTEREYVEDTYKVEAADPTSAKLPYMCRSYSRRELDLWGGEVIDAEYWRAWSGRHWAQGERIAPPEPSTQGGAHNHACFLIRA